MEIGKKLRKRKSKKKLALCRDEFKCELRLSELRKEKKETQEDIAEFLGIEPKTFAGYESNLLHDDFGFPKIPANHLIKLANHYGKSVDYLLGISDYTQDGNEYISGKTGLSDKAINQLRKCVQHDKVIAESNKKNQKRIDDGKVANVRPVLLPLHIPVINYIIEQKRFFNLVSSFLYLCHADKFTTFLDDGFKQLKTRSLYPADQDLIAGAGGIKIDADTHKAIAKNLLDVHINALADGFKRKH